MARRRKPKKVSLDNPACPICRKTRYLTQTADDSLLVMVCEKCKVAFWIEDATDTDLDSGSLDDDDDICKICLGEGCFMCQSAVPDSPGSPEKPALQAADPIFGHVEELSYEL